MLRFPDTVSLSQVSKARSPPRRTKTCSWGPRPWGTQIRANWTHRSGLNGGHCFEQRSSARLDQLPRGEADRVRRDQFPSSKRGRGCAQPHRIRARRQPRRSRLRMWLQVGNGCRWEPGSRRRARPERRARRSRQSACRRRREKRARRWWLRRLCAFQCPARPGRRRDKNCSGSSRSRIHSVFSEAVEAGGGEQNGVHLALGQLAQARVDVAAKLDAYDIGPQRLQLRAAALAAGAHLRALRQRRRDSRT